MTPLLLAIALAPATAPADPPTAAPPTAAPDTTPSAPPPAAAPPDDTVAPGPSPEPPADDEPEGAGSKAAAPAEPAPNPPPETQPQPGQAVGGRGYTPLPRPRAPEDPSTIQPKPWRGRGWFQVDIDLVVPVGGSDAAQGNVITAAGGFAIGWRVRHWVALYTALSTFVHDAEIETTFDDNGEPVDVTGFGRIVAFDLVTARFFLPYGRRVQAWADVGAGVGVRRPPFGDRGEAVGLVRTGPGLDIWLGQTFTLDVAAHYRLIAVGSGAAHSLTFGLGAAVHW